MDKSINRNKFQQFRDSNVQFCQNFQNETFINKDDIKWLTKHIPKEQSDEDKKDGNV